jgi:hypothetical protein
VLFIYDYRSENIGRLDEGVWRSAIGYRRRSYESVSRWQNWALVMREGMGRKEGGWGLSPCSGGLTRIEGRRKGSSAMDQPLYHLGMLLYEQAKVTPRDSSLDSR